MDNITSVTHARADGQMPIIKNIHRQMFSVGDPLKLTVYDTQCITFETNGINLHKMDSLEKAGGYCIVMNERFTNDEIFRKYNCQSHCYYSN